MLIARTFPRAQFWCSSPEATWQESSWWLCALLWHRCVLVALKRLLIKRVNALPLQCSLSWAVLLA